MTGAPIDGGIRVQLNFGDERHQALQRAVMAALDQAQMNYAVHERGLTVIATSVSALMDVVAPVLDEHRRALRMELFGDSD